MVAWTEQMTRFPLTIPPKNLHQLPPTIFISYDFIWWMLSAVENIVNIVIFLHIYKRLYYITFMSIQLFGTYLIMS